MPFTYRDNPKLSDRLWGKSGEEIFNELANDFNSNRRRVFESPFGRQRHNYAPGFSRVFPFADDQKRTNIRSYLDEIAARHPEFADQLQEPPWDEDFNDLRCRQSSVINPEKEHDTNEKASTSGYHPSTIQEPRLNLNNFGLRNTVPLGPENLTKKGRHQRSMSAPPDHRTIEKPKRFVTKCEIPIMHNPTQESATLKSDTPGKSLPENTQQKGNNTPNVRVIPIQVEGRDAPLLNANVDTSTNFGSETFRDGTFDGRLPRDFGAYQKHSPRFSHKERTPTPPNQQYAHQYQQYVPSQQHFSPAQHPYMNQPQFAPQQQFAGHHKQQQMPSNYQYQDNSYANQHPHIQKSPAFPQPKEPQPSQAVGKAARIDETDSKLSQPPKVEPIKNPIERVQLIQEEVEELMKQVESFNGNSRTDKQYLMLDELLTRQLLLLDNIDTEGKENVRQARKDTIRSIQRCISTLENKVPLPENIEIAENETKGESDNKDMVRDVLSGQQSMEVDKTKENTPVDNREKQNMEVDEKIEKSTEENREK